MGDTWLLRDLRESLDYSNFWFFSALYAFRASKQRFLLGYLHQPLSTLLLAAFITFFLSSVFERGQEEYFFYVVFGLATWHFTSSIVSGSVDAIYKNRGVLKQIYLPFSAVVLKSIVIACIGFVVEVVALSIVYGLYTGNFAFLVLYPLIIAVLVLLAVSFVISLVVSYVGNLLPDVSVFIPSVMRGAFFITPIFWYIDDVSPEKQAVMLFNPFYSFITLVRAAIIDGRIDPQSLILTLAMLAAGLVVVALIRLDRNRIIGRM